MERHLMDKVSKFTLEEIYSELETIKKDLNWLDDTIHLSKSERQLFNDISFRVKKLLGCNR